MNLMRNKFINMENKVPNKHDMYCVLLNELFQQIHGIYSQIKSFVCQLNNETNFRFQIKNYRNEIEYIILDKLTTRVSLLRCKDGFDIRSNNPGIELGFLGDKAKDKIKMLESEIF